MCDVRVCVVCTFQEHRQGPPIYRCGETRLHENDLSVLVLVLGLVRPGLLPYFTLMLILNKLPYCLHGAPNMHKASTATKCTTRLHLLFGCTCSTGEALCSDLTDLDLALIILMISSLVLPQINSCNFI